MNEEIKQALASIRQSITQETISYSEMAFLQDHQDEVKKLYPESPEMWSYAGIPEKEWDKR